MKRFNFTKMIVMVYSVAFIIWISLSYALAFLDKSEIAQDLSSQVVIVGVAAILGYMLKAFFETREEEKIKLDRDIYFQEQTAEIEEELEEAEAEEYFE